MKRFLAALALALLIPSIAPAAHNFPEKHFQNVWCAQNEGKTEVVTDDGARVDCVTKTHAVEFDFGRKWAEAVGQALLYSAQTGKRAGIVLILEEEGDVRYWHRLVRTINSHCLPIDIWQMR